jgi:hypothetical protein
MRNQVAQLLKDGASQDARWGRAICETRPIARKSLAQRKGVS